jgi:hypothetical protein
LARTAVLFSSLAAVLAACQDQGTLPTVPNPSSLSAPLRDVNASGTTATSFKSELDQNLCLSVVGAIVEGAPTALRRCDGSANQSFTVRTDGTIRVNDGLCLDVFGAFGNEGDDVVVWECHGRANQVWTFDATEGIHTFNGRCLTAVMHFRPGYPIVVSDCASSPNQRWVRTVGNGPTSQGTPTPTPTPPPPTPPAGDLVSQLLGSLPSSSTISALGGVFATYERDFPTYDDGQWAECGPRWDCIDYYDRAEIYYARWKRTGDTKYLDRANQIAVNFRTNYIEANGYGIAHHWAMMEGVGLHYAVTGDPASLTAVGKVADVFAWLVRGGESGYLSTAAVMDNRIQAYYIRSLLVAYLLKAPSVGVDRYGFPGGNDWAALLRAGLNEILGSRDADGQWRGARCQQPDGSIVRATHPFPVGLLYDALIQYYELFEPDPRIPAAIKQSADVMWRDDWIPTAQAYKYVAIECPGEGGPNPAGDLNALILNGYAFVGKTMGDPTFAQRADQIFAGAVNARGVTGDAKHFNQQYTGSSFYLRNRAQ